MRHERRAVSQYRRDPLQAFAKLRRWRLVALDDAAPRALVELVDPLVEMRVFLHQPQVGLADCVRNVRMHQRPEVERADLRPGRTREDRELDRLCCPGMPGAEVRAEQQHARRDCTGDSRSCGRPRRYGAGFGGHHDCFPVILHLSFTRGDEKCTSCVACGSGYYLQRAASPGSRRSGVLAHANACDGRFGIASRHCASRDHRRTARAWRRRCRGNVPRDARTRPGARIRARFTARCIVRRVDSA